MGAAVLVAACGDSSHLAPEKSVGPNAELPAPSRSLIPTVHVAEARGWPEGRKPVAAQGLTVTAFATTLDHPPFANGMPAGNPVDVLTGFVNGEDHALGRPVGVAIDKRGGLLVADDVGNAVWRVAASR
jgi:glucose/arabinose dehydrogenase